mgnify:CR=1 FL=1
MLDRMTDVELTAGTRERDDETRFSIRIRDLVGRSAAIELEFTPEEMLRMLSGTMMRMQATTHNIETWGWSYASDSEVVVYDHVGYGEAAKNEARKALTVLRERLLRRYPGGIVTLREEDAWNPHRSVKCAEGQSAYCVTWSVTYPREESDTA